MSLIFPKKEILYAPMLGSLGGGSARGFGRGKGKRVYGPTPRFVAEGQAYTLSAFSDPIIFASDNGHINLSSSTYNDTHNYYTTDNYNRSWYIAANWTYNDNGATIGNTNLTRWSGVNPMELTTTTNRQALAYTTADGRAVYTNNVRGLTQITGTSAGVFEDLQLGSFYHDCSTFGNGAGDGYASWYADNNTSQSRYPNVISRIYGYFVDSNFSGSNFDGVTIGNDEGGFVYWRPLEGTSEVMIDFANFHSNSRCSVTVWDDSIGDIVYQWNYGYFSNGGNGGGTLNDSSSRTLTISHDPNYVYIHGDHEGTVAGSHYYLYR